MHSNYRITTIQYTTYSSKWLKWLQRGDSISINFPYMSDRLVRLEQLSSQISEIPNYYPVMIDPSISYFDSYPDFKTYLTKTINSIHPQIDLENLQTNQKIVLIIINGDSLLAFSHQKTLEILQHLATEYLGSLSIITGYETDCLSKLNNLLNYSLLFQNVDYYPLYDQIDTDNFLEFLAQIWNISLPAKIKHLILAQTSGSFWLAKQALRVFLEKDFFDDQDPSFVFRLESMCNLLTEDEARILGSVGKSKNLHSTSSYDHLKKIGLLDEHDKCSLPALLPYIEKKLRKQNQLLLLGDHLSWNNLPISHLLSKHEKSLLIAMIQRPNTNFTREELSTFLWPQNPEDHYSSWAIDQAMKRLRDKLVSLGLPATTIKSIRGIGYEYRN